MSRRLIIIFFFFSPFLLLSSSFIHSLLLHNVRVYIKVLLDCSRGSDGGGGGSICAKLSPAWSGSDRSGRCAALCFAVLCCAWRWIDDATNGSYRIHKGSWWMMNFYILWCTSRVSSRSSPSSYSYSFYWAVPTGPIRSSLLWQKEEKEETRN